MKPCFADFEAYRPPVRSRLPAFSEHFRDHLMPRLRNLVTAEAVCIAKGIEDWNGAYAAVWRYARKYGAMYLPNDKLGELEDWIATTLLIELDRAERLSGVS